MGDETEGNEVPEVKMINDESEASEGAETVDTADKNESEEKLSKRQLRRLKKQEKWLLHKSEIRAREKEKKKQRKREAIARGESVGPTRKMLKKNTMAKSSCQIRVAIDCSFDKLMSEKDIMKLVKQIQFCYSSNRRADNPMQYYVCGINGQTKQRLEGIGDFVNWDANFAEKNYDEEFTKENIVYLSSESPNILTDLEPSKVYIIGGLVDHNHHKGLCYNLAVEKGINHAQLPISDFIDLKSRKVLTINHVFDILLRFTETKSWQDAFCVVLPQRKGVKVKGISEGEKINQSEPANESDSGHDKLHCKSDSTSDQESSSDSKGFEPSVTIETDKQELSSVNSSHGVDSTMKSEPLCDVIVTSNTDVLRSTEKQNDNKSDTGENDAGDSDTSETNSGKNDTAIK